MTQLQEAARKALYALEASIDGDHPYYDDQLTAIEALRAALEQPIIQNQIFMDISVPQPTSSDYALGYAEGFNDACKPSPQAQPVANLADDEILKMARENAALRVALREIQDAANWAYGVVADKLRRAT